MAKIPKNRPDSEMIGKWQEKASFEHICEEESEPVKLSAKVAKKEAGKTAHAAFLTPEIQEDLSKALLTLKVNLFKVGIIDYTLKISCEADQIVLKAIPVKKRPKPADIGR